MSSQEEKLETKPTKAPQEEKEVEGSLGDLVITAVTHLSDRAKIYRDYLKAQKLIRIRINKTEEEPKGVMHPFCINEFRFAVPKGRYVEVPSPVADLIVDAYEQADNVSENNQYNLKNNTAARKEFER